MKWMGVFLLMAVAFISGCKDQQGSVTMDNAALNGGSEAAAEYVNPNDFKPFYVYANKGERGNHYVPSGFMGSAACLTFNDAWTQECPSGHSCIKIDYDVECSQGDQKWGGIYWLNPANNWGSRKGGFNLEGAQRLSFWAKGEKGGEQIEEFTIGGITGTYPDTDVAVLGPVILTDEWQQYVIDLRGKNLSYISGGFAWTTNDEVNRESFTFYLDDIRYE